MQEQSPEQLRETPHSLEVLLEKCLVNVIKRRDIEYITHQYTTDTESATFFLGPTND